MKAAIILLLVGFAAAQQGFGGGGFGGSSGGGFSGSSGSGFSGSSGGGFGGSSGGGFGGSSNRYIGRNRPSTNVRTSGGGFGGPRFNPCARIESMFAGQRREWGPKAWGLGLNNPCAFPPNPFLMERAIALTNQVPGTLVKVDRDGEIELTDRFGREANVIDVWGRDLTDALDV